MDDSDDQPDYHDIDDIDGWSWPVLGDIDGKELGKPSRKKRKEPVFWNQVHLGGFWDFSLDW